MSLLAFVSRLSLSQGSGLVFMGGLILALVAYFFTVPNVLKVNRDLPSSALRTLSILILVIRTKDDDIFPQDQKAYPSLEIFSTLLTLI